MSDGYHAWANGYFAGTMDAANRALELMDMGLSPKIAVLKALATNLTFIAQVGENWQHREAVVRILRTAPLTVNFMEGSQNEQKRS